jgi:hypothetical protein
LPKALADGSTQLRLTPLEVIERLAALILLSRRGATTTYEALAPNSRDPTAAFGPRVPASECRKVADSVEKPVASRSRI